MCGINGYVGRNNPVREMNAALLHRGPDYQGTYDDQGVHLGHCLLSIRGEPLASHQPYTKSGSPWVLIFKGQVYNTKQLSRDFSIPLQDLDTAMIFDLIEKIGWDFIHHIHGMFGIALYNKDEKIVRLYRDDAGQKPLYYSKTHDGVVFSSELKGLQSAGIRFEPDTYSTTIAGALGYIPGDRTLFSNVRKLDAGETVTIHTDGRIEQAYRPLSQKSHLTGTSSEVLTQTVQEHLQSKQKVALNLSGGMDSSLLLHEMKAAGHTMTTYTTSFEGAGESFNDDAVIACQLAKEYGTNHTEIIITKDIYQKNFIESYERLEEPNYNISLPTYLEVAKREGVSGDGNRVILSGNGGDEVFGGYPYYGKSLAYTKQIGRITPQLFNVWKWARTGNYWRYQKPVERWLAFKYFDFMGMPTAQKEVSLYIETIAEKRGLVFGDPVRDMMLLDRTIWLPGESFMQADKIYMGESLEMRAPLAYQPLRAYFDAKLNTHDYIANGGNKEYLRRLYKGKLPDYVVERKAKTGWRSPVRPWYDSEMKKLFLQILSEAPRGGIVRWDHIQKEVASKDTWPGKYVFLYLSLAILSKKYNVAL